MRFHKKKSYQLDTAAANSALQNILSSCGQAPNTIPFDKLVLRRKANTAFYNRMLIATATVLLLTFLCPLVIVPASSLFVVEPASLVEDYVKDELLYLELSGDHILYAEAYMETDSGAVFQPVFVEKRRSTIAFDFPTENAKIYIPVKDADPLILFFNLTE